MIEFAALLLVSILFGGMMLYSFGFAPMVFSALPAEDASRFIRAGFSLVLSVRHRHRWFRRRDPVLVEFSVRHAGARDRRYRHLCAPGADAPDQRPARRAVTGEG
jgi:hypothetical protein